MPPLRSSSILAHETASVGRTIFVTGAIAMESQEKTSPQGQRAGSLPVASGAGQAGALQQGLAPLSADQADHGGAPH